jgi:hypothetical protein
MQKHFIRTIQQEKTKENKKQIKDIITGEEIQTDVMQSITNIIIFPNKRWKELKPKEYLSTRSCFHLKQNLEMNCGK